MQILIDWHIKSSALNMEKANKCNCQASKLG